MKPARRASSTDPPGVSPPIDGRPAHLASPGPSDPKTAPKAIFVTLRKCIAMMPTAMRWKWALLAPLSVLTGIIEAGAAAAVFALIKIIGDPAQMTRIPIASSIANAFPYASPERRGLIFIGLIAVYYMVKNLLAIEAQYLRHKIPANPSLR